MVYGAGDRVAAGDRQRKVRLWSTAASGCAEAGAAYSAGGGESCGFDFCPLPFSSSWRASLPRWLAIASTDARITTPSPAPQASGRLPINPRARCDGFSRRRKGGEVVRAPAPDDRLVIQKQMM
jgi:hypothetical protein